MNETKRRQDSMYAMLAITAQEPHPSGPCPSPEELAAFSQGMLPDSRHQAVLAHLPACAPCRNELIDIAGLYCDAPCEAPARRPFSLVEAVHSGAAWLSSLKERIVKGVKLSEQEASLLGQDLMAVLLPGLAQPAEVMAQSVETELLQCPWCGAVGQTEPLRDPWPDPRNKRWFRCDACGGAFRKSS